MTDIKTKSSVGITISKIWVAPLEGRYLEVEAHNYFPNLWWSQGWAQKTQLISLIFRDHTPQNKHEYQDYGFGYWPLRNLEIPVFRLR